MLVRHALIRLEDGERREARRLELLEELDSLLASLPDVKGYELGQAFDKASLSSWDIVAVIRFDNEAMLAEFGVNPLVSAFTKEALAEGVACVKAWNFVIR